MNWYNKLSEEESFQDLLGAETLPNSITEKKLKEVGLVFGEDGAEVNTQEQVKYLSPFLETKIDLDEYDYALNIFYVYKGEHLDTYRKKFEEIKNKVPINLKGWDEIVYQDYPELVANLLGSLQEFIDYQATQLSEEELPNQNTQVNWADYEHFFGSKD